MRSWELKGTKQPARCACYLFRAGLFRWGACVGVLPSVHFEPWEVVQGAQNSGLAHVACVEVSRFPNTACAGLSLVAGHAGQSLVQATGHGPLLHKTPGRHS